MKWKLRVLPSVNHLVCFLWPLKSRADGIVQRVRVYMLFCGLCAVICGCRLTLTTTTGASISLQMDCCQLVRDVVPNWPAAARPVWSEDQCDQSRKLWHVTQTNIVGIIFLTLQLPVLVANAPPCVQCCSSKLFYFPRQDTWGRRRCVILINALLYFNLTSKLKP